ncbi:histidine phosphatase family protein [Loktanella sp. Alg231-35]|uniref:histidine phosphatase family protein n=1 Tax=Loktanella sp. Alg231-35 TaxID=1922220 RepID=UPI000D54DDD5|nr:histidine phosphatase family protein [Loktanella sp. Alg231-35]
MPRFLTTLLFGTAAVLPSAMIAQEATTSDLVSALKGGGHVIYLRHAMTETDYADQVAAVLGDCATQRVLSADGWVQAKSIGGAIAALDIPVGKIVSSEYCRAWQTADLAFGQFEMTAALNFATAEDYTDADISQMRDGVAPLISAVPTAGNTVIVGHDDPFEAATGIYPEPQGVAYVVLPDGAGGFEVLGRIGPDDWSDAM